VLLAREWSRIKIRLNFLCIMIGPFMVQLLSAKTTDLFYK
jgi:hypothetical protein